ncbi:MAG: ribulose-phosphate 3-epimerase [Phycisphaerae bacterium]|nr:ribulose-phosphate 3-epimerase [Phycisphaerae bacterium]
MTNPREIQTLSMKDSGGGAAGRAALPRSPGIRVAPSLLAADFSKLAEEIAVVERAGAEILHLDVMDGHFVPNLSFGIPVIASLRAHSRMCFDVHLMIENPQRYVEAFVRAGCDHVTFHLEATIPPSDAPGGSGLPGRILPVVSFPEAARRASVLIDRLHALGVTAGVCLNPATPAEAVLPVLPEADMILVMSVWPGFGGQAFMPEVLATVSALKSRLRPDQRLEIDGGIASATVGLAVRAGADTLVAGSAVFNGRDAGVSYADLLRRAETSLSGGQAVERT